MCINPLLYICRVMDRVTINNKKHFTFDLSHHSFDKAKKDMIIKATLENHKVEMPPVIDRRDHITSKALACPGDYRGLPTTPVGSTSRMIRTPVSYTHLRAHETRHDLVCRLLLEKK